ncbi:MAG: putative 4-mercaptohistidine N1-methyltransferase [Verrucomicrobiales bacterium]|nr:putative 4-mercaptohistidine N1-methyltransferase [Verrucomicrobiales bacterium]
MKNGYESRRLLDQYLLFHYGSAEQILQGSHLDWQPDHEGLHFSVATVFSTLIFDLISEKQEGSLRALDVGCAVGRSSFELSRLCGEVMALDYSQAFIHAAQQLQQGQPMRVMRYGEGQVGSELDVSLPTGVAAERIKFEVGDAMNLREDLGSFDLVHAANLLCRLSEPMRFLERLPALVKPGGQLVLATPCSWSEEFTPLENQPSGTTLDLIRSSLGEAFELKRELELPFVIRDHARKFQISTSQTTVWLRK